MRAAIATNSGRLWIALMSVSTKACVGVLRPALTARSSSSNAFWASCSRRSDGWAGLPAPQAYTQAAL